MNMRDIIDLIEEGIATSGRQTPSMLKKLPELERHRLLSFIHSWLGGSYMGPTKDQTVVSTWEELHRLFPVKANGKVTLYRLVTIPKRLAEKKMISFRPAPGQISSWASNLTGADCAAGIAREHEEDMSSTARVVIKAEVDAATILASTATIKKMVNTLAHDYFDRYPDTEHVEIRTDGPYKGSKVHSMVRHPEYPGGDDTNLTMDDVGYMLDVCSRRGGWCRQYEYVVRTPELVEAEIVRIYRIGDRELRQGNDDPHN
jgi:hypothetical protein